MIIMIYAEGDGTLRAQIRLNSTDFFLAEKVGTRKPPIANSPFAIRCNSNAEFYDDYDLRRGGWYTDETD